MDTVLNTFDLKSIPDDNFTNATQGPYADR